MLKRQFIENMFRSLIVEVKSPKKSASDAFSTWKTQYKCIKMAMDWNDFQHINLFNYNYYSV